MQVFVVDIIFRENVPCVLNKWAEKGTINSILVFTLGSARPLIEETLKAVATGEESAR